MPQAQTIYPNQQMAMQPQDIIGMLSQLDPNEFQQLLNTDVSQIAPEKRSGWQKFKDFFKGVGKGTKEFFGGTPGQFQFYTPYIPQQQQAIMDILNQALGGLQDPSSGFAPIAEQARTQFQQETVPSIAERFTGLGGGQRSSAFGQNLGQAGANLEQTLAGMQAQYGLQRGNQLQQLLGLGLTPQYESAYMPGQAGLLRSAAPAIGRGLGMALGGLI